jgi:hypothetical protein
MPLWKLLSYRKFRRENHWSSVFGVTVVKTVKALEVAGSTAVNAAVEAGQERAPKAPGRTWVQSVRRRTLLRPEELGADLLEMVEELAGE